LTRRTILGDGQFAGYERTRPENGGRAQLQGLELTLEQELEAFHQNLKGIEFQVHYTYQDSRQSVEDRAGESLPLTGRPTHELAVQLAYDRGGYYASVELEHTSRTLDSIGRNADEDRIVPSRNDWNLSLSREFRKGLRVFLDVKNLTALAERRYRGDTSRPDSYALDLREYRLGMKWEK
ncbi:MAG: TonB-dependent receptor, partial [Opitutus sp.]